MLIEPVRHIGRPEKRFLKEIARKPFAADSVGSSGDRAPAAVGEIYTKSGLMQDSVQRPGQLVHEIR